MHLAGLAPYRPTRCPTNPRSDVSVDRPTKRFSSQVTRLAANPVSHRFVGNQALAVRDVLQICENLGVRSETEDAIGNDDRLPSFFVGPSHERLDPLFSLFTLLGGQIEVAIRFTFTLTEETQSLISEFIMLGRAHSKRREIGICTLSGMMASSIRPLVPCTTHHKLIFNKRSLILCDKSNHPA